MDRQEFTKKLEEAMGAMSGEDIEKAIMALTECKNTIYERECTKRGDHSRRLYSTGKNGAVLKIRSSSKENRELKTVGASLLSVSDYRKYRKNISKETWGGMQSDPLYSWWLYEGETVNSQGLTVDRMDSMGTIGYIRPVLITESAKEAGLIPGNLFYINDEMFCVFSDEILLKYACLGEKCTFNVYNNYKGSMIEMCVEGWYAKLVKENETLSQKGISQGA